MIEHKETLSKYLPDNTSSIVSDWIAAFGIYLRITGSRTTKLGDYYPPIKNNFHRITINRDLNKYAFLITFVHEMAHLHVWEQYKNSVRPHGEEWKLEFKKLMDLFFDLDVFPPDVSAPLKKYLSNPKASTLGDLALSRALRNYDIDNSRILLENLPYDTVFQIKNGKTFRKGEKLRKRYRCICLDNKRIYLVNPLVEVIPLK